jgi:hypothetical protein
MFDESISEQLHWEDLIGITKEQWMIILEDPDLITEKDFQLLELIFDCKDCETSSSELARLLNMDSHGPINLQVGRLGKRIAKKLNIQVPTRSPFTNDPMWWSVPFREGMRHHADCCVTIPLRVPHVFARVELAL